MGDAVKLRHAQNPVMLKTAVLLLCLALAACGGGGDPGPTQAAAAAPVAQAPVAQATPTPVVQAAPCPKTSVRVQLFGDSTQVPQAANLQPLMDARFGPGVVTVENRAVGHTYGQQLIGGSDGMNLPWPQSVASDIVVVNHGINDAHRSLDLAQYAANLRAWLTAPAVVVLETPNPVNSDFSTDAYAGTVRSVATAERAPLADTAAFVAAMPGWQALLPDGLHPTPELYAQIAQRVLMPTLEPIAAKMLCR